MRIIAGRLGGRILFTLAGPGLRPATDRVKGTIYNVLQNRLDLSGTRVLDLFAGTGSLGFEALSRGAASVVFVDNTRKVLDVIRKNAENLGCTDSCELVEADAISTIGRLRAAFNLIFADPPYAFERTSDLPEMIFAAGLLAQGGLLIIEHAKRTTFPPSTLCSIAVQKRFGNTRVSFFSYSSSDGGILS